MLRAYPRRAARCTRAAAALRRSSPIVAALALAGCGVVNTSSKLGPARPLAIALDGQPSALYAPIYEGLADGEFARGALRVAVTPASSDASALGALESGRAQVAIVSEPALLAARASGKPLVAIGALENGPLDAIISLRPIRSAAALAGRTVATDGSPLASAELASYLATAGVPPARVRTTAGGSQALTAHKAIATIGRWDYDAVALALAHRHPSVIRLAAAGVPTFTDLAIAVRVGEARHQGALLRAFLQSLTRAESATRANPQGVAELLARVNPALGQRFELAALAATQTAAAPASGAQPFGYQSPYQWQSFGAWMVAHGLLPSAGVAGDTITDEFLPGQGE